MPCSTKNAAAHMCSLAFGSKDSHRSLTPGRPPRIRASRMSGRRISGTSRRFPRHFRNLGVNKSDRELSESAARICPRKSPPKRGLWESYFLEGIIGKTHTQNLQILREDTLGATCSAGPFCLLPRFFLRKRRKRRQEPELPDFA